MEYNKRITDILGLYFKLVTNLRLRITELESENKHLKRELYVNNLEKISKRGNNKESYFYSPYLVTTSH